MPYEIVKEISLNPYSGSILITSKKAGSNTPYEKWYYRLTCPIFEVKVISLANDILKEKFAPDDSCSQKELFSLLFEAKSYLDIDTDSMDFKYKTKTSDSFFDFIAKAVAIPYSFSAEIDMEKVKAEIEEKLRPKFLNEYKNANNDSARKGLTALLGGGYTKNMEVK